MHLSGAFKYFAENATSVLLQLEKFKKKKKKIAICDILVTITLE